MRYILSMFFSFGCATVCSAVPITLIHEGSGAGTLNGVAFANTSFVVTAQGDTVNRQFEAPDVYFIDHDTAQINLSGVGTFAFTSGTRTFVNQGSPIVGFSRASAAGLDLFNGPINALYATWDMLSSIGPHSGAGNLLQWTNSPVTTTGGTLVFNSAGTQATFTARIVPEPMAALLVLGGALAGGMQFRPGRTRVRST